MFGPYKEANVKRLLSIVNQAIKKLPMTKLPLGTLILL